MRSLALLTIIAAIVCGCSDPPAREKTPVAVPAAMEVAPAQPASPVASIRKALGIGKAGELKKVGDSIVAANLQRTDATSLAPLADQQLRLLDIKDTSIADLSPLAGQPIEELYAENSKVESIEPLRGMPLSKLYLSQTAVSDLTALENVRLVELNLVDSKVADLTPLAGASIGTLWLRRCPVEDLSPLSAVRLVSLDVGETKVADLSPLSGMLSLKRLQIAETDVTDLTPLADIQLDRLVFSPWKIEKGLEVIREMSSLQQLDVAFDDSGNALRPDEFWKRWDAGELKAPEASEAVEGVQVGRRRSSHRLVLATCNRPSMK